MENIKIFVEGRKVADFELPDSKKIDVEIETELKDDIASVRRLLGFNILAPALAICADAWTQDFDILPRLKFVGFHTIFIIKI